jgi:hypothetical protein
VNQFEFRIAQSQDATKVAAFNQRLAAAGETYHRLSLEQPFRTMVHREDLPITVEKFFCFDGDEIRGGISIKRMMFRINGRFEEVTFCVYPLSEGIVNPKYNMVGLLIEKELLRRFPLKYSMGTTKMSYEGSSALRIPFHFTVLRTRSFLRNITYLRKKKWMCILFDLAAFGGVGTIGLQCFKLFLRLRNRHPDTKNLTTEKFDGWGDWADEVWETVRDSYSLIGDRSKAALKSLYPEGHEHLIKLRFMTANTKRLLGWAVLTVSKMKNHHYFGNMVLGAIVDMLAAPNDALSVVSGALIVARQSKADVVVVNHSDQRWNDAFKRAGMLPWRSNFFLILSSKLEAQFNPIENYADRFFFTRGDGHGPTSLWIADYRSQETADQFSKSVGN